MLTKFLEDRASHFSSFAHGDCYCVTLIHVRHLDHHSGLEKGNNLRTDIRALQADPTFHKSKDSS